MKNHFAALALTGLIGLAPHALAASSVELTVKGFITPLACTPSLSNSGLVDFGKVPRRDLNVDKRTRLRDQALDFSIQCTTPGRFALLMRDNREGSAIVNSQIYYGLDYDGSGNKIGLYSLNFNPENTVVDDLSQVFRTDSTTGGLAWSTSNDRPIPIAARSYLGFTDRAGSNAGPIAIRHLTSRVIVETVIAPTSELDLSTDVQIDGKATLEIVYL
ncbi:Protein GltF [Pseudomonas fluorescens]|uniref:Protein GltF n=1 Tax=Pseudomonas fluorescens TaxID=294 RepID=A0A8H2NY15_PSEFL|nr:DUF1120 domain-containing protein [Pseudomonas fluorescens]VVP57958.1 Protein GltF [Pseudomonas fluorescens]